jgi:hypothetical protein
MIIARHLLIVEKYTSKKPDREILKREVIKKTNIFKI